MSYQVPKKNLKRNDKEMDKEVLERLPFWVRELLKISGEIKEVKEGEKYEN